MNDYAIYDLARQRYADLLRTAVQESQRPPRARPEPRWHRLAAFAQLLVGRTAAKI
ncbi:hypothetical protein [Tenggerimyces flavus]|uniref:Uncharacterized protein n=1 Tax=Tenggerimyces flavus TaxID=1708749 RepID=A0ABV7YRP0_9ACTN|nr:hypothetical protein [Tenggerimyces flavus]MBM7786479.1 hypothetical protein [Tenggerimyces flavus]